MPSALRLLRQLRAVRPVFEAAAEQRKQQLLNELAKLRLTSVRHLIAFHEDLLFLAAFPGARATRLRTLRELAGFSRRWRDVGGRARRAADDTGIAGTVSRPLLSWPLVVGLARREAIEIDWSAVEDHDALDALMARLVPESEEDAYASGHYSTRAWVDLARPQAQAQTVLEWLVRSAGDSDRSKDFAAAWNDADVPLRWSLNDSPRAITHARLPRSRPALRSGLRRLTDPPARHIERPLTTIERLPVRGARRVIELARDALAARGREVHAMTHANPAEVHYADLEEGVELAVIGVSPPQRLTLEANYGYLLISNGVPIGYGGVTPLYRQANTGINVFDAFRGSEAAFLWAQILRAFRTLFGVRRFVVNGYQFGAGNSEAIRSGAYWFYYRLGFRPGRPEEAALAAREARRLAKARAAPTSASVLRRLARGDLFLDLEDFSPGDAFDEAVLPVLGGAIARRIASLPVRSHGEGERYLARALAEELAVGSMAGWSKSERDAFRRLAPLTALAGPSRSPAERRDRLRWIRAKGAPAEREFALLSSQQTRLFAALKVVGRGELNRVSEASTGLPRGSE
jgi:hypothetical protein